MKYKTVLFLLPLIFLTSCLANYPVTERNGDTKIIGTEIIRYDREKEEKKQDDEREQIEEKTKSGKILHYYEEGIASWYGPGFYGRKTASGDKFVKGSLTAAHRTLPLNSVVKVTNPSNMKSVIVLVNDRGPYSPNRLIDISQSAAEVIGIKNQGIAKVIVEYLHDHTEQISSKALHKDYYLRHFPVKETVPRKLVKNKEKPKQDNYVQIGPYNTKKEAENIGKSLSNLAKLDINQLKKKFYILLGPINDKKKLDQIVLKIKKKGVHNVKIKS